jgi:chaperonin GroES
MAALSYDDLPEPFAEEFELGMPEMGEPAPETESDQPQHEGTLQLEQIAAEGIDLAFKLPEDVLAKIAGICTEAYERDKSERADWEEDFDKTAAMMGGRRQAKSFPWPRASNVIYPLIATASLQFGARAYPAIVKGRDVTKVRVNGADPDGQKRQRAERIKEHMNWQLLEDMPEWEDETDKLVHMLPWQGCVFRQAVWDKTYSRPQTSLISARCLVVTQSAKDLETVPLFTKEFTLFPHEIKERMRDGRYAEEDITFTSEEAKQGEQQMLECHCRYDLDEDDYAEPWIAIIHKDSGKLLSLKAGFWPAGVERAKGEPEMTFDNMGMAQVVETPGRVLRVRRHVEFTKYDFVPDFEGKFLGLGFGFLLREHNDIINTIINQLLDAATDQNAGGGFIGKGVGLKGGSLSFDPGEWKMINADGNDLRSNIVPRITSQPSPTLFQLLGVMIEAGKELASIRDALTGEVAANQPATTTLAIIEQGLQVFSSIYKRIYRALGKELKLIYQLNSAYLGDEAYYYVLDDQKAIAREDYKIGDHDVMPVADPSITTSGQKLARAQFLGTFLGQPDVNNQEIRRRMMDAADIEDIDKILPEPGPEQQAQKQAEMMASVKAALAEIRKTEAEADEKEASAKLKNVQAAAAGQTAMLDTIGAIVAVEQIKLGESPDGGQAAQGPAGVLPGGVGGLGGMAGQSPDQGVPVVAGPPLGAPQEAIPGPAMEPAGAGPQPAPPGAFPGV